ncbi:MAG: toll/interleukin-1 receptor domain-containing protein [Trichloromonas sp.]|jgi:hypothetical protein|nr:toll/interleukin-1 receptor domain-containing protein [Trichloromonas sp.]
MAETDIYIVHASEDLEIAKILYDHLSVQWDVWWDDLMAGEVQDNVEEEISKAKCVVAVFSTHARKKPTVISELNNARALGKKILPIRIDHSKPPYSFDTLSIIEMVGWTGNVDHDGFRQLQRRLARLVKPKSPRRPKNILSGRIPLPTVFMSVSSHETKIFPVDAVNVLKACEMPAILISAYDLVARRKPEGLINAVRSYRDNNGVVLVDSGNYEKSRRGNNRWKPDDLKEVLAATPHDLAFCFDVMNPNPNVEQAVNEIVAAVERDRSFSREPVIPVIHAPKLEEGGYSLEYLPQIVREVCNALEPPIVAIPERELGAGIIARAKMVRSIRTELDKLHHYQPIHLLGTGHPWSIAILAAAGADTFDGLEWCRYTIDPELEGINHFHHFDLFGKNDDERIGFAGNVAIHNLVYYRSLSEIMHDMFLKNSVERFVHGIVGKKVFPIITEQFPELFQ